MPPVARITPTACWRMSSRVPSSVACCIQPIRPSGAPAASAARLEQRGCLANAFDRRGMRAQHNRIARLDGNQRLVNRRGGRIRTRNHRGDHAHRRRHFHDALLAVLAQDAHGAHPANCARHVHGSQSIFYDFVGNISEAGFLDCGAGKRSHIVRGSLRAGFDNGIHLFLRKCGEFFLGGGSAGHQFAGFLNGDEVAVAQAQNALPSPSWERKIPPLKRRATTTTDLLLCSGGGASTGQNLFHMLVRARDHVYR